MSDWWIKAIDRVGMPAAMCAVLIYFTWHQTNALSKQSDALQLFVTATVRDTTAALVRAEETNKRVEASLDEILAIRERWIDALERQTEVSERVLQRLDPRGGGP
jgi:hypothetical protein